MSIAVGAFVWVLGSAASATAQPYADSAHGNTSYGVNRSGTGYDIGSCAHCHDVLDPDICGNNTYGLRLFASNDSPGSQTDNFCFQCHKGTGSVQVGGITNHTYSKNFGGGSATLTTIYDAFNPATGGTPSSHNLSDIQGYVAGFHGYTSETNACLACHNHHVAQQNYPVTFTGMGGVATAIRRPVHHETLPGNLWGDEDFATSGLYEVTNEVFGAYGLTYQAPYYTGGSSYEPANNTTSDGSNLPNLITFCLDCHSHDNVPSTERGRYLRKIDWSDNPIRDEHGMRNQYMNTNVGTTRDPYPDQAGNYMLVCTDCHEPHGSENEWLLRTSVNGKDNITVEFSGDWLEFCTACHTINTQFPHYGQVTTCWGDGSWNCHHHGSGGGMF